MNYRCFVKNRKAISPIFATLILIAIAVIAGVVVYMFTSGTLATMTGGGTAAQEKVAVQGVSYPGTGTTITIYAQNQATSGTVTVSGFLVKDSQGNVFTSGTVSAGTSSLVAGQLVSCAGTLGKAITKGVYTVTLSTAGGGSFVSSSFTVA